MPECRVPKHPINNIFYKGSSKAISDVRYCDVHSLRETFMPVAKRQQRLDDTIPLMPIASDECVLRIHDMEQREAMMSRPELPKRGGWKVEVPSLEWTDLIPEDARAHILGGGSCLISGPAGSGKSTLVKSIVEELRKSKQVALISKTHVAGGIRDRDVENLYI